MGKHYNIRKQKEIWYAIYKGDDFVFQGTRKECAEKFGVSEQTIAFLATPTNLKRDKGDKLIAVKVDDKDLI